MRRRDFLAITGAALAQAVTQAALAQQAVKLPRVAWLANSLLSVADFTAPGLGPFALLEGLAVLGYVAGKTIAIEYFLAPAVEELPAFAAKAVATGPDLIIAAVTLGALAARKATSTIPIVFYNSAVPVETGIVASLAHPGGNVTGVTSVNNQLAGKGLEILGEIIRGLSQVAIVYQPEEPAGGFALAQILKDAPALGINAFVVNAPQGSDFDLVFAEARARGAQAAQVIDTAYFNQFREPIVAAAAKQRLPTIYASPVSADVGGLISYGANTVETARHAASFVDRILRGAKPADMPVEQPTAFDLVVNLKTAQDLGLTIPPSILLRATRLIQV